MRASFFLMFKPFINFKNKLQVRVCVRLKEKPNNYKVIILRNQRKLCKSNELWKVKLKIFLLSKFSRDVKYYNNRLFLAHMKFKNLKVIAHVLQ